MRDIREILSKCSQQFGESNFGLSSFQSRQNKEMPMYLLSRDGFMLVVMGGFTGAKARARSLSRSLPLFFPSKTMCPRASFAHERGNMTHGMDSRCNGVFKACSWAFLRKHDLG
jgi:hypothetical protein